MKSLNRKEEMVMLAILKLKADAYLITIHQYLVELTGDKISLTSIHKPLNDLEKSGYIVSDFGEATATRGGRRKRIYSVTSEGHEKLAEVKRINELMWDVYSEYSDQRGT